MEAFQEALLKKTPCNECRIKKRKCSHEKPCSGCLKKKIDCVYNLVVSPVDKEYMRELEYAEQIECLESQICLMENELSLLKLAQQKNNNTTKKREEMDLASHYPSPMLTDAGDTPHVFSWLAFEQHSESDDEHIWRKNDELIAESGDFRVYVSNKTKKRNKKSCILSVNKGEITINTFISSHTDLLNTLHDVLYQIESDQNTPFTLLPSCFPENGALSSLLWRGYGKQLIKNIAKPMPLKKELKSLAITRNTISSDKLVITTFQLVHAYINCLHLNQFYIHVPFFMTHFIQPDQPSRNILRSPAVMALCSTICLQACQHVSAIISPATSCASSFSSSCYALYYFELARELISDRFDEFSLEVMITYAFMAFHKLKLNNKEESLKYIELAKRIYTTLEPIYAKNENAIESASFYRMNRCIRYIYETASLQKVIKRGGFNKYGGKNGFSDMLKRNDMLPMMISEQDTPLEKEMVLLIQLKTQLQESFYSIMLTRPNLTKLTACIGEFSHQMEMALRHWYRQLLPQHFQLKSPLFETNRSDYDFNLMLEEECGGDTVSPKLLCGIYVYYTYLLMGRCYIPKYPNEFHPPPNEVQEYLRILEMERNTKHAASPTRAVRRWEKFLHRKVYGGELELQLDGIDKEEIKHIEHLFMSVKQDEWNFNLPLARTSVIAALQLVRLVEYLMRKEYACFLDYKWLMNACEILIRASRFKYDILEEGITLDRIRASIVLSINLIRNYSVNEKVESVDAILTQLQYEYEESICI